MDGRHLAHSLRQSFGPDIRLIALTSRDDPEDRARSAAAALTAENRPPDIDRDRLRGVGIATGSP